MVVLGLCHRDTDMQINRYLRRQEIICVTGLLSILFLAPSSLRPVLLLLFMGHQVHTSTSVLVQGSFALI